MIALRAPHYLALTAAALAAAVGVWLLREFDPNAAHSPFPGCMFRALTGYFCVGRGLTRALHALVHGDLARAFAMNPLAMLLLPAIPMMIAHGQGWRPRTLEPVMRVLLAPRFWLVLLPAYWIARNLPWFPFSMLAPG